MFGYKINNFELFEDKLFVIYGLYLNVFNLEGQLMTRLKLNMEQAVFCQLIDKQLCVIGSNGTILAVDLQFLEQRQINKLNATVKEVVFN